MHNWFIFKHQFYHIMVEMDLQAYYWKTVSRIGRIKVGRLP